MYQAAVILHIVAAVTWVGGMLFLVLVLVPLTRKELDMPGQGAVLLRQAARRFLPVAWTSIVVLVVTGVFIAWDHWGIRPGNFFTSGGHFFRTLQIKLGLAVLVIGLSLVHDFVLGPYVVRQLENRPVAGGPPLPSRARVLLLLLARINLVLVLIILALAVALIRP